MNLRLIESVLLAWPVAVALLFRLIGPRGAVLVGILGGVLFLPTGQVKLGGPAVAFPLDKWNATGLGLILGVLAFDLRGLRAARPRWFDLAMALYYLAPLVGLRTGVPGTPVDVLDVMIGRGLGRVVPYIMGRLYLGRGDGPLVLARALVISGLAYIPVCVYEQVVGPSSYLAGLIYGIPHQPGMVDRLGGWRPEGFLGSGLAVAAWMAMTTVMATWLWLAGGWRAAQWPSWMPALALLATTLSCRGVYGYVLMAIGLPAVLLTRWLRTRAILILLALLPASYMTLRATGLWDGAILVRAAGVTGRPATVAWRLQAEDEVIRRVVAYNPAVGLGTYIWHAADLLWPDGSWLHALWMGGLVGLVLQLAANYLMPAGLGLARPRDDPAAWGLAAWCLLSMIDGLHNSSDFTPTALVAGALVGAYLAGDAVGPDPSATRRASRPGKRVEAVPLVAAVVVLAIVEVIGRLPRPVPSTPPPPAAASVSSSPPP